LAEEYRGKVVFAGVSNNDTVDEGIGYRDEYEVPYALGHSPETWEAFEVPYQPVTIVIDERGGMVERIDGPVTYEDLKEVIERVA
jgi:hypothetical protein